MKWLGFFLLAGCATLRPLTASNDDEQDYRAVRMAQSWGSRLSRSQRYLEIHPSGTYVAELKEIFGREEPLFFDRASATREGTSGYLADLPHGPHANAAISLLVAFDAKVEDFETFKLMKAARSTEKSLAEAAEERRAADEWLSSSIAALADDGSYGKPIEDAPVLLGALKGAHASTWGGIPTAREGRFGYGVPAPEGLRRRLAVARLAVTVEGGIVRAGRLEGVDLFVRWAEIDALRPLDAAKTEDRAFAASRVRERLMGMLEKRFPEKTCSSGGDLADLIARTCAGRRVRVLMGGGENETDRLDFTPAP